MQKKLILSICSFRQVLKGVILLTLIFCAHASNAQITIEQSVNNITQIAALIVQANANSSSDVFIANLTNDIVVTEEWNTQPGNALPFFRPMRSSPRFIIDGQGHTISRAEDATGDFRFAAVYDGLRTAQGTLVLENLTLKNFKLTGLDGGAVFVSDQAYLRLNKVTLIDNQVVRNSEAAVSGGAIFGGQGTEVYIYNSSFLNNTATIGGAVASDRAIVDIATSEFTDNRAEDHGGAISSHRSVNLIYKSRFSNNTSADLGGGIYTFNSKLRLYSSTMNGNRAVEGGALYIERDDGLGFTSHTLPLVLMSTLSGNMATNGGGALHMQSGGQAQIEFSTITDNTGIAGIDLQASSVKFLGSIMAGNKGTSFAEIGCDSASNSDVFGGSAVSFLGDDRFDHAQAVDPNCTFTNSSLSFIEGFKDSNSSVRLSNLLQPLDDNGCDTLSGAGDNQSCFLTHGLSENSPALDVNDPFRREDQRGVSSIGLADIGAFEGFIPQMACFVVPSKGGNIVNFCL